MAWTLDNTHSTVDFTVKHMMIATVRGRFKDFEGTLELNEENPSASRIEGTVDVASIDTNDANRDGHLRSADFFEVEKFPTMHFRSTRIEPVSDSRFKVTGDLTIRDITGEIVWDVTYEGQGQDPWGKQRRAFSAQATLNRKDFGLTWNVALETGGVLVSDEIKLHADIQIVEEQAQPEPEAEGELVTA